jgi:hypothetical protein
VKDNRRRNTPWLRENGVFQASPEEIYPEQAGITIKPRVVNFDIDRPVIDFKSARCIYNQITQTKAINFTASLIHAKVDATTSIRIIADGNTVTFTGMKQKNTTSGFDTNGGTLNTVEFYYDGVDVWYTVSQEGAWPGGPGAIFYVITLNQVIDVYASTPGHINFVLGAAYQITDGANYYFTHAIADNLLDVKALYYDSNGNFYGEVMMSWDDGQIQYIKVTENETYGYFEAWMYNGQETVMNSLIDAYGTGQLLNCRFYGPSEVTLHASVQLQGLTMEYLSSLIMEANTTLDSAHIKASGTLFIAEDSAASAIDVHPGGNLTIQSNLTVNNVIVQGGTWVIPTGATLINNIVLPANGTKRWKARMSQAGGDEPIVDEILENTYFDDFTFQRTNTGQYKIVSAGTPFTANKTYMLFGPNNFASSSGNGGAFHDGDSISTSEHEFWTPDIFGSASDDMMFKAIVIIETTV